MNPDNMNNKSITITQFWFHFKMSLDLVQHDLKTIK